MTEPFVIDLRDPDYWRDPYPTLRQARGRGRTAVTHTGEPVVLTADDNELLHTSAAFAQMATALPGYDARLAGRILDAFEVAEPIPAE